MDNRTHFLKKLIVVLGILLILEFAWYATGNTTAQQTDRDSLFSNITVSYEDPVSKLEKEGGTLIHRTIMYIEEGHLAFNSAEIWRGNLNELELGINYTRKAQLDLANSERLVIVLRDGSGIPWYTGDFSLPTPNNNESSSGIVWIRMTTNPSVLQNIADERARFIF